MSDCPTKAQPHGTLLATEELAGVSCRLFGFPPGTSARIDVPARAPGADLMWTRQKARTPALRGLVLADEVPSLDDGGFDVVHRIVEAAAQVVGEASGSEVGAVEIAIVAVNKPGDVARSLDGLAGPWSMTTSHGEPVRITPRGGADAAAAMDTTNVEITGEGDQG